MRMVDWNKMTQKKYVKGRTEQCAIISLQACVG